MNTPFLAALTAPQTTPTNSFSPHDQPPDSLNCTPLPTLVDFSKKNVEKKSRSSDNPDDLQAKDLFQPVYVPTGMWRWINGVAIANPTSRLLVHSGQRYSIHIKSGWAVDRTITYMSKCWRRDVNLDGLITELTLYKNQLSSVQGLIVPTVIGVYTSPTDISIAAAPPHESFWIEASPSMPRVLKKRCVEAYEKLHAIGVCHGNVKLRNMLIGADARVTLINFEAGRASNYNADLPIPFATPTNFRQEMRKVKLLLRFSDVEEPRNVPDRSAIPRLRILRPVNPRPPNDLHGLQDLVLPATDEPRRFVIPGESGAGLHSHVTRLLSLIEELEKNYVPQSTIEDTPSSSSHASSKGKRGSLQTESNSEDQFSTPLRSILVGSTLRKRKATSQRKNVKRLRFSLDTSRPCDQPTHIAVVPSYPHQSSDGDMFPDADAQDNDNDDLSLSGDDPFARRRQIVERNIQRCLELGLPHPEALKRDPMNPHWRHPNVMEYIRRHNDRVATIELENRLHPSQLIRFPRARRAEGNLKRAIQEISMSLEVADARDNDHDGHRGPGKRKRAESPDWQLSVSDGDTEAPLAKRAKILSMARPAVTGRDGSLGRPGHLVNMTFPSSPKSSTVKIGSSIPSRGTGTPQGSSVWSHSPSFSEYLLLPPAPETHAEERKTPPPGSSSSYVAGPMYAVLFPRWSRMFCRLFETSIPSL